MFRRLATIAVLTAIAGTTPALAQSVSQIGGPKELPPAGFKGQMYVDSRGCVFLRAGLNGNTNWVPRVNRARKALCGYPPTMAAMGKPVEVATPAEIAAAPAPSPRATSKPLDTVASLTTPPAIRATGPARPVPPEVRRTQPAPVPGYPAPDYARAATAPRLPAATVSQATAQAGQVGCHPSAPVPRVFALSNGGHAVLCTRGDGSLNGLRAPVYARVAEGVGTRTGAGLYAPGSADRTVVSSRVQGGQVVVRQQGADAFPLPQGYKHAWTDDRLNPLRGYGTPQGQIAQDQVWTRDVPAQALQIAPIPMHPSQRVVVSSKSTGGNVHVSTRSQPAAVIPAAPVMRQSAVQPQAASRGGLYVQVGTFGVPSNAEGVRARLRAAGLPVGTAQTQKGGKALQMVMAGPFGDAGSAQSALSAVRAAGFGDAYIR